MNSLLLRLVSILVLGSASASAGVLVVAADGSGNYLQIQPAVDAALDADVVLVKAGTYPAFTIGGKGLAVVADTGASVQSAGAIVVRNVPAGRSVVLAGIAATGLSNSTAAHGDGLFVENCAGAVRVERCTLSGAYVASLPVSQRVRPGAEVKTSGDVAFASCTLRGKTATGTCGAQGGDGLVLASSSIALYDCQLFGGDGTDGGSCCTTLQGGGGGHGLEASAAFVFASNTSFSGGDAGDGAYHGCGGDYPDGGAGGSGMALTSSTQAKLVECSFEYGLGGAPGEGYGICATCPGKPGPPGVASYATGGSSVATLAATKRRMQVSNVVRELAPLVFECDGRPEDDVFLVMWQQPSFVYSAALYGVRLVLPPFPPRILIAGTTDARGHLSTGIAFPDLGPGVQAQIVFVQALFRDTIERLVLGSNASVVVLDQAF